VRGYCGEAVLEKGKKGLAEEKVTRMENAERLFVWCRGAELRRTAEASVGKVRGGVGRRGGWWRGVAKIGEEGPFGRREEYYRESSENPLKSR